MPLDLPLAISLFCHTGTIQRASSRLATPLMAWRDKARCFISPTSRLPFKSKFVDENTKPRWSICIRCAPPAGSFHCQSSPKPPNTFHGSCPLDAVVASVQDSGPFWRAPSSHCKYKNHPAIHPAIALLYLCILLTTCPLPIFSVTLARAYARLKRRACKNSNNNQPTGAKGMSPFCFLQLMILSTYLSVLQ